MTFAAVPRFWCRTRIHTFTFTTRLRLICCVYVAFGPLRLGPDFARLRLRSLSRCVAHTALHAFSVSSSLCVAYVCPARTRLRLLRTFVCVCDFTRGYARLRLCVYHVAGSSLSRLPWISYSWFAFCPRPHTAVCAHGCYARLDLDAVFWFPFCCVYTRAHTTRIAADLTLLHFGYLCARLRCARLHVARAVLHGSPLWVAVCTHVAICWFTFTFGCTHDAFSFTLPRCRIAVAAHLPLRSASLWFGYTAHYCGSHTYRTRRLRLPTLRDLLVYARLLRWLPCAAGWLLVCVSPLHRTVWVTHGFLPGSRYTRSAVGLRLRGLRLCAAVLPWTSLSLDGCRLRAHGSLVVVMPLAASLDCGLPLSSPLLSARSFSYSRCMVAPTTPTHTRVCRIARTTRTRTHTRLPFPAHYARLTVVLDCVLLHTVLDCVVAALHGYAPGFYAFCGCCTRLLRSQILSLFLWCAHARLCRTLRCVAFALRLRCGLSRYALRCVRLGALILDLGRVFTRLHVARVCTSGTFTRTRVYTHVRSLHAHGLISPASLDLKFARIRIYARFAQLHARICVHTARARATPHTRLPRTRTLCGYPRVHTTAHIWISARCRCGLVGSSGLLRVLVAVAARARTRARAVTDLVAGRLRAHYIATLPSPGLPAPPTRIALHTAVTRGCVGCAATVVGSDLSRTRYAYTTVTLLPRTAVVTRLRCALRCRTRCAHTHTRSQLRFCVHVWVAISGSLSRAVGCPVTYATLLLRHAFARVCVSLHISRLHVILRLSRLHVLWILRTFTRCCGFCDLSLSSSYLVFIYLVYFGSFLSENDEEKRSLFYGFYALRLLHVWITFYICYVCTHFVCCGSLSAHSGPYPLDYVRCYI